MRLLLRFWGDNNWLKLRALQAHVLLEASEHPSPICQIQFLQSRSAVPIVEEGLALRHDLLSPASFQALWQGVFIDEELVMIFWLWHEMVECVELLECFSYGLHHLLISLFALYLRKRLLLDIPLYLVLVGL